jgi:drug/metabolite transporter (DMT)-like permease
MSTRVRPVELGSSSVGRRVAGLLRRNSLANAVIFTTCWGMQTAVAKVAYRQGASIGALSLVSVATTLSVLGALALIWHRSALRALRGRSLGRVLVANGLHAGLGNLVALAGIALTTAVNAAFLMQCQAAFTVAVARLALAERVTAAKAMSLAGMVAGAFLLTTGGRLEQPRPGDILILLGCCCWAAATVLLRPLLRSGQVSADVATALRPVAGLPVMVVSVALASVLRTPVSSPLELGSPSWEILGLGVVYGVLQSGTWLFMLRTLRLASASYTAMMGTLSAVVVAGLATVVLGERISAVQAGGALLILAAGAITQLEADPAASRHGWACVGLLVRSLQERLRRGDAHQWEARPGLPPPTGAVPGQAAGGPATRAVTGLAALQAPLVGPDETQAM